MQIVLVAHHGSSTSSDAALVAATAPRYAVISAAFGNQWGFPRPAVLSAWLAAGSCVPSTATGGQLVFAGDGRQRLRLVREHRRDRRGPWLASPQPPARGCGVHGPAADAVPDSAATAELPGV